MPIVAISGQGHSIKELARRIVKRSHCQYLQEDGNCAKTNKYCPSIQDNNCPKTGEQT